MEKRYNTNWYMTLMFMLSMVVSLSFSACSDDDKKQFGARYDKYLCY